MKKPTTNVLATCCVAAIIMLLPAFCRAQDKSHPPGARTILSRMLAVYNNAASYQDTGELRVLDDDPSLLDVPHSPETEAKNRLSVSFSTYFVRQPTMFRFDWQNSWGKNSRRSAVWFDSKHAYSWDSDSALGGDRFLLNQEDSLSLLINQKTASSASTMLTVPGLLMTDLVPHTFADVVQDLTDVRIVREEPVEDAMCFLIRGRAGRTPWLLWIDKKAYYLRKMRSVFSVGSFHEAQKSEYVAEEIRRHIEINKPITEKIFHYRPEFRRGDLDASDDRRP
ncbi:MAG TPA: hypothetical protein VHH35_18495 [Pyrinomonadaceae bacterium]|nr:hypothetical protein [Pyrinomonadaceae bacterium]